MMFPLTPQAQRIMVLAEKEARRLGHQVVGTEHLLLAILQEGEELSKKIGVSADQVRTTIEQIIGTGESGSDVRGYSARVKKVLEIALFEARSSGMLPPSTAITCFSV